ncbi:MAG: hypothetical protein CMO55_03310 [Verrucomicrobiales bacterium]|nr:hypothetical protein [Verrucomicrobiales bacterium]
MALSPSLDIPEHYRRQFADNWDHSVNQEIQRLGNRVRVDQWDGKEKVYNTIDELEWTERSGRLTGSTPQEVTGRARKIVKRDFKCQVIFDRVDDDFLGQLGRPDSEVQEEMRRSWNRSVDTKIAIACNQTEYGGEEPYTTAIDLPDDQKIDADFGGSAVGMTPEKLEEAVRILETHDIFADEEDLVLVMGPQEKRDLLQALKTATNEVWANMIGAWHEGIENKLYGMEVVISNRLQYDPDADVATCFVYSKDRGIIVCPDSMQIKFDERPDMDHAVQISAYAQYAFMRRYEKTVVTIDCDRSPA